MVERPCDGRAIVSIRADGGQASVALLEKSEWVAIPVPEIIPAKEFNLVQERLHSRRPSVTPPRITNSDVLLTGRLRCESCGGNMMLRTGTRKSGGRYRYYACASHQI